MKSGSGIPLQIYLVQVILSSEGMDGQAINYWMNGAMAYDALDKAGDIYLFAVKLCMERGGKGSTCLTFGGFENRKPFFLTTNLDMLLTSLIWCDQGVCKRVYKGMMMGGFKASSRAEF
jgi:hypothetical protein